MSVNIATILKIPSMTSRAATTIAGLVLIVVVACAGLVPGQDVRAFGVETAIGAVTALLLASRSAIEILRFRPAGTGPALAAGKAALGVAPIAGALAGGALLCCQLALSCCPASRRFLSRMPTVIAAPHDIAAAA